MASDSSSVKENVSIYATDHDARVKKNLWSYAKEFIERPKSALPSFDRTRCQEYFKSVLSRVRPNKIFSIPNWIPRFPNPRKSFDLSPPTYQEVTRVIRKMKSSGSPCPLDQISVIPFKHCPYLRSYITDLISLAWRQGSVPHEWKRAVTILLHKKGDKSDPANFRPITLESIPLKIFTSSVA